MEAVGQLAGGIAHDFNNLLTVISGYTEILLRRLGREAEGSKEIAEVSKAAERAARLTRQLLAYSRKQVLEPRALDLNDVVTETQTMLERVIGENIEFSTTLAEDLGSISADDGQIEQIIMNLVVNARDAMPEGGKLLLETGNVTLADRSPDTTPGDYVVLTVTDTGQGMDAATAGRIFEPFYTTKDARCGHRARPLDRLRHRQAERRPHRGRERARHGHHLPALLPAGGREGRSVQPEAARRTLADGIGDGSPRRGRRRSARCGQGDPRDVRLHRSARRLTGPPGSSSRRTIPTRSNC